MKGRIRELMRVWPQAQKEMVLPSLIIGAAGLDPSIVYPGFKKVLLSLTQTEYEERRNKRNLKHPEYAKQGIHLMEDWLHLTKWDKVINASGRVLDTVGAVQSYMGQWREVGNKRTYS
jgi:hypothetical protein